MVSSFKGVIKGLHTLEKLFLFTVCLSCFLGFYLPFYKHLESLIGFFLSAFTLALVYYGITRYNNEKDWLKRDIFYYVLIIVLVFHLPSFYLASSRTTYAMVVKDDKLIKGDTFFLGWAFPKGQVSLYLDQSDTIGPHTATGIFVNNVLQVFYLSYYAIPYITLYFFSLAKCILNTVHRRRNNGNKSLQHDNDMNNLFYVFSVYNITYFFVFFINTLVPASSPRLYLKEEYQHPLTLTGFSLFINKVCKDNRSANSFPSGHVAETFCIAYALFPIKYTKSAVLALVCSIMIAFATLFLRYHYFVDVLCALVISTFCFIVSTYVLNISKGEKIEDIAYTREAEVV